MPTIDMPLIFSDVLEACHADLRRHFEPHILATAALAEVEVLTALTLRLVRLAKATALLCEAGIGEESQLQFRSATDITVSLLYIMNVGPMVEAKSRTELAEQFRAYADVANNKMLRRRPERARAAFKNNHGMSDADFDAFLLDKERRKNEAINVHGCTSARWHRKNLQDMAEIVRDNAPAFFAESDHKTADFAFSSFVSANSATHGDALSLRSQYKELGNAPLEVIYNQKSVYAAAVATEAFWAWKSIGEYYNQLEYVNKCISDNLLAVVQKTTA